MLFARSLAQKLGLKCNLQAFSLHPGVIFTNLDRDVDWSVGMKELRMLQDQFFSSLSPSLSLIVRVIGDAGKGFISANGLPCV